MRHLLGGPGPGAIAGTCAPLFASGIRPLRQSSCANASPRSVVIGRLLEFVIQERRARRNPAVHFGRNSGRRDAQFGGLAHALEAHPKAVAVLLEAFDGVVAELKLRTTSERERAAKIIIRLGSAASWR